VIRVAYRERARRHHPDRVGAASDDAGVMSALNEAYRVLGDPGRRALYDRSLSGGGTPVITETSESERGGSEPTIVRGPTVLAPAGPARVPWKLMAVMAVIGSGAVFVAAAFNDPPSTEPPDGILRTGSCVAIEPNGDAREVACTGTDDVVVELLVPTDTECPADLAAHRDRLGLGTACVVRD
jgi:molecular chaperone DnaJ